MPSNVNTRAHGVVRLMFHAYTTVSVHMCTFPEMEMHVEEEKHSMLSVYHHHRSMMAVLWHMDASTAGEVMKLE